MHIQQRTELFFSAKGKPLMTALPKQLYIFYRDGFRAMVVGRTLWRIIAIKLFIMFAVLKLFFFPNYLKTNFNTEHERASHVLENLTRTPWTR
ncbi:MAG: DUF4492 domain-containing protein [Desulfurivibrionaceae bacterium]